MHHRLDGNGITRDRRSGRQHNRALVRVLELAHVARPVILLERRDHVVVHRFDRLGVPCRMFVSEPFHEHWNILDAFAKRGYGNRDHVQAIVQIVLEPTLVHELTQIAVRRSDDTNIDAFCPFRAEGLDFALLQNAQQLGLQPRAHAVDLVEKDRAAVGESELALPRGGRVRRRTSIDGLLKDIDKAIGE